MSEYFFIWWNNDFNRPGMISVEMEYSCSLCFH